MHYGVMQCFYTAPSNCLKINLTLKLILMMIIQCSSLVEFLAVTITNKNIKSTKCVLYVLTHLTAEDIVVY